LQVVQFQAEECVFGGDEGRRADLLVRGQGEEGEMCGAANCGAHKPSISRTDLVAFRFSFGFAFGFSFEKPNKFAIAVT
jgi:hypothetical protein